MQPQGESQSWQSVTRGEELGGWLHQVSTMPLLGQVADRSMALLDVKRGERVVEVGCGSGAFLPGLARAVGEAGAVVGLDHSADLVQQARERTRNTRWVQVDEGDAYALPYTDQSFDAAHCDRVLMHLDDPSAVLAEMRRIVRPGGRVVVAEPDWASIVLDSADHVAMVLLVQQANTVRRQPHIGRELNRRMAAVGLMDRRIETVPIFSLDYSELVMYGLNLSHAADQLAAAGRLDRQYAQVLIDAAETASRDGTFCAYGGYFVARGLVPTSE